ncbi:MULTISPECIES: phage GP46 family protein [unclassified Pseudomonas]|uniref:phage GP46 family protein n=1 Tax=unclassified Pseudomonas TaxID=196821 RepID=UPI002B228321|nr:MULTISPECIES: phage GP46 family protein [unclassified Pseudomonas]MEA9997044.1 phage GP46 family protein [Pseudomonas sp. AA4]MEB0089234.1 phage GP46 family protein [Pseudomonas sp. RTI1]MEB0128426.1 phage GP46 family protein [Pseudomonas sp. CCC1.2]MEB0155324.1 phage GP46 family protein [Pseudomonas sp. CCC4.3]MEB0221692.1 phage GP46 family protein [Pseudomonas sp. AB12(2023)]
MSDISTVWNVDTGMGDWSVSGGALASGDDLETAVLISVFSDRLAGDDDVLPDGSTDRRGFWGDDDVPLGSKLWLLDRSRLTTDVANTAKIYIEESLKWIIDDGVASSVKVTMSIVPPRTLGALVVITRGDGTVVSLSFSRLWQQF